MNKIKSIIYIGNYVKDYPRSYIFLKGLRENNINVEEFNFKTFNFLRNLVLFFKNFKKLKKGNYDLILVASSNFIQCFFAKILSKIKKIPFIYDIYISKLQTFYYDRDLYNKNKLPKKIYPIFLYLQDFFECFLADFIILDTYAHIKFFHEKFNIPVIKFRRVLVGAQDDIFFPVEKAGNRNNKFVVGFCGSYIPLQGVKYIIRAAKILEGDNQIRFILIGNGQTYQKNLKLAHELGLNNIEFVDPVPLKKLPELLSKFDIGLGIFGNTPKTLQVIPNKIYDGIAMKIPMISCDSPAIKELYKDGESIILCEQANPKSLANAILKLKNDAELREKIKQNAYNNFKKLCTIDAISKNLIKTLNDILTINK